jgi:hypothetical protein
MSNLEEHRLREPNKRLSQIFAYWPPVILVVGGTIVTLAWIGALVWLILRSFNVL